MGIRLEIKKHINYTEYNKTCGNCVYSSETAGGNLACTKFSDLTELAVSPDGSCDHCDPEETREIRETEGEGG